MRPWWWLVGYRNVLRWWWQEYQRYQRSHWVLHWMTEKYGPADCMLGQRSWRIHGVLCTIWLDPMRLKVYHAGGRATKDFELTDPIDAAAAQRHLAKLGLPSRKKLSKRNIGPKRPSDIIYVMKECGCIVPVSLKVHDIMSVPLDDVDLECSHAKCKVPVTE